MSQAATDSKPKKSGSPHSQQPLTRLLAMARPYILLILAIVLLSGLFAAGRFGRAYMMKPLLDGILVPAATSQSHFDQPLIGPRSESIEKKPTQHEVRESNALHKTTEPQPADSPEIWAALKRLLAIGALIIFITPIALFGRTYLSDFTMGRIHLDLQRKLASKLLQMPMSSHNEARQGDLLTRLQHDINSAREVNQLVLQNFTISICMVAAGLFSLFYISWPLALLSLCVAPPIAGIMLFFGRSIRKRSLHRQAQLGQVTGRLMGILSGIKVIKAFNGEENESRAFGEEAGRFFRHDMRVARHRAFSRAAVEGLNSAAGIGVLAAAILFVISGRFGLSLGDVAWFSTALATSYKPVKDLARGWGKLMEHVASGERLFSLLDAEEEPSDDPKAEALVSIEEEIRFRDIHFSYRDSQGRKKQVLDGFNLRVNAGDVIAIVGRTGAGKTSLMDLLLRFSEPDSGCIEIDGRDIQRLRRQDLLNQVAIVTQEAFLFDTTILENIRYGRLEASDDEVFSAARIAHVDEFVDPLPDQWQTQVGEFGALLSGGQRQRITIARAVLRQPSILIFDEATSALDAKTEKTVQDAVQSLRGQRTIFLIAHRLSTVRQADRIIVLDEGRPVDSGNHEELMQKRGLYYEWTQLQNSQEGPA